VVATTATLTLHVNAGSAVFDATQHLAGLTIAAGASAIMNANGNRYLQTASLSIVGSGKLDLNDNDLIVDYSGATPFTQVRQWVIDGYSTTINPAKSGIVSSTSQADGGKTILAVFDTALTGASDWPPGSGNTTDSTTVIGKYTWFGDVNLDGQVTGDDYTVVDTHLDTSPPPGSAWPDGDANLDGIVSGDDYTTIDTNLGLGVGNPL
jgi:hypothetical protein